MKKKLIFLILVLVILFIAIFWGWMYASRNRRTYELTLPFLEKVQSISLKQNDQMQKIDDATQIKEIRNILMGTKRITQKESMEDFPFSFQDGIKVDFNLKEGGTSSFFVYLKNKQYYIEQPYNGIYPITKEEYHSLIEYL